MPTSVIASVVGALVAGGAAAIGAPALLATVAGAAATFGVSTLFRSTLAKDGAALQTPARSVTVSGRSSNSAWQVIYGEVRAGGVISYMETTNNNQFLHMVITLACHEVQDITEIYFNEELIPLDGSGNATGKYAGYVHVEKNYGTDSQTAFAGLVAGSAGKWTSNDRQRGHAGIYVRLAWNSDKFPQGLPNITAVVQGRKVYDPRSATTAYSSNAALCIADYLTNSKFGYGAVYADEIDETFLTAAANVCDEAVALAGGGTENRYECHGMFSVDLTPEQIMGELLTSLNGSAVYVGGKWRILAAAYQTPTVTLNLDGAGSVLTGPVQFTTRQSRRNLANGVKGQYISPANKWQPTDFPAVASATYLAEDNSERIWRDITLNFTKSAACAQRIAKTVLERNRRQIEVRLQCNLDAYQVITGDTVMVNSTRYGWSAKVFEVMESSLSFDETVGVSLLLREIDSGVYSWSSTEEEAEYVAATTSLPDPFTVGMPGNPGFAEELYETTGSAGVKSRLIVSWSPPSDQFVEEGGWYQLEYMPSGGSTWTVVTNIRANAFSINDAPIGQYDFRVKSINVLNVESSYATGTYNIAGLSALPSAVQNFAVRPSTGYAHLTWTLHADLDVRIGGEIEVRHTSIGSLGGVNWSDSSLIDAYNGGAVTGVGPLIRGYYIARAKDSTGNYQSSLSTFYADEALITGFTTVKSTVEGPTYTGSKVNLTLTSSILQMTNPGSLTATYYFPATPFYVDCGSVAVRRYEADLYVLRFDTSDLIDSRAAVDTWPSVDGGGVERGNVQVYAQITNDNPASSPTWSAWTPFSVAEFSARAARYKLEYVTESATWNIGVTDANVHIKVPS
jgi:hypothetical protein